MKFLKQQFKIRKLDKRRARKPRLRMPVPKPGWAFKDRKKYDRNENKEIEREALRLALSSDNGVEE